MVREGESETLKILQYIAVEFFSIGIRGRSRCWRLSKISGLRCARNCVLSRVRESKYATENYFLARNVISHVSDLPIDLPAAHVLREDSHDLFIKLFNSIWNFGNNTWYKICRLTRDKYKISIIETRIHVCSQVLRRRRYPWISGRNDFLRNIAVRYFSQLREKYFVVVSRKGIRARGASAWSREPPPWFGFSSAK